jgi:hypothetical protein
MCPIIDHVVLGVIILFQDVKSSAPPTQISFLSDPSQTINEPVSYAGNLLSLVDTQRSYYPGVIPKASIGTLIAEM